MLPEVTLNASTLSSDAFYIDLDVSLLSADYISPSGIVSGLPSSEAGLTLLPSLVQRVAAGFNSRLRALIDSGSSHCFVSTRVCESIGFSPYAVSPVKLRYLDGSSSIINRQLQLLPRFPSGDVHLMEFYVTRLDSACDLVLGLNWLRRFNPLIDWRSATMQFRPVYDESIVSTLPETIPDQIGRAHV